MTNRQQQHYDAKVAGTVPSVPESLGDSNVGEDAPPATGECVDDSNVERIADAQRLPGSLKGAAPARGKGKSGQKQPGRRPRKPGPPNPFGELLASAVAPLLANDVDGKLQAAAVADELIDRYPKRFLGMKRKSLCKAVQRYCAEWREQHGRPPVRLRRSSPVEKPRRRGKRRPLTLRQDHVPGREAQVDFTDCSGLGVTINGKRYDHELFTFRLSYSKWTYVEVAAAETTSALLKGLQKALRELGGTPEVVRSDNGGNAIHEGKPTRPYRDFLNHYGLKVTLINPGCPWENGVAERTNGVVKTAIDQALRIRGHRDFKRNWDYVAFVRKLVVRINRRSEVVQKLAEERDFLRAMPPQPAPEHVVLMRRVQNTSFIEVYRCRYSVPAKALGEMVTVRLYADHLEVYRYNRRPLTRWLRLHGKGQVVADPRHLINDVGRQFPIVRWRQFPMVLSRDRSGAVCQFSQSGLLEKSD